MAAGVVSAPLIITSSSSHTHASRRDIHTDTLVFIQSDTPGALIFYTLDGSRPESDPGGPAARGRRYSRPIRLPAGRVAVRAVAVTSDGRRSSTVTKMFVVRDSHLEEKVPEVPQQLGSEEASPAGRSPAELWTGGDGSAAQNGPDLQGSDALKQVRSTQTSRLDQAGRPGQDPDLLWDNEVLTDADLLRCPPDPFSRFCPSCGAKVSDRRLPPTGVEQEHRVCGCCGSGNPVNVSSCLTCESFLQPVCVRASLPGPSAGRQLRCCCVCRWNQPESRFCSCCSSKPVQASTCALCWRCGASGHPASSYCTTCGVLLRAPTPPTSSGVATAPPVEDPPNYTATPSPDCAWKMAPPTAEKSTQTVGLYYPSATQMQKERERALQLGRQRAGDRQPPLTSVSPGKGYWRRQLDHVCAHLRSYTQNNAPFRALLGDPSLGELLSAVVQDEQQQLTLTLSFALAGQAGTQGGARPGGWTASTSSWRCAPSQGEAAAAGGGVEAAEPPAGGGSQRSDALPAGGGASGRLQVRDAQLLMELAPGRGQLSVVQQLLDQGADPACCHSNGRHALAVAVLNGHHQVLPVLVQRGADVDQQSGPMKNSALHEAAALGPDGLQAAQVLLSCGANVRRKNGGGQTAFELAALAGSSHMVALLAAQTGLALLDKLVGKK